MRKTKCKGENCKDFVVITWVFERKNPGLGRYDYTECEGAKASRQKATQMMCTDCHTVREIAL